MDDIDTILSPILDRLEAACQTIGKLNAVNADQSDVIRDMARSTSLDASRIVDLERKLAQVSAKLNDAIRG